MIVERCWDHISRVMVGYCRSVCSPFFDPFPEAVAEKKIPGRLRDSVNYVSRSLAMSLKDNVWERVILGLRYSGDICQLVST